MEYELRLSTEIDGNRRKNVLLHKNLQKIWCCSYGDLQTSPENSDIVRKMQSGNPALQFPVCHGLRAHGGRAVLGGAEALVGPALHGVLPGAREEAGGRAVGCRRQAAGDRRQGWRPLEAARGSRRRLEAARGSSKAARGS